MKNNLLKKRLLPISLAATLTCLSNNSGAATIPELGSVYNPAKQYAIAKELIQDGATATNLNSGLRWLRLAASQQHTEALYHLGFYHEFGLHGLEQDYNKAAALYKKSAQKNHIAAQLRLSDLFLHKGLSIYDLKQGQLWLEQAASHNDAKAQFKLAMFYKNRLSNSHEKITPRSMEAFGFHSKEYNEQDMLRWLNKSAANGHQEAQYMLGTYYLQGSFLPQDSTKAFYWFTQAALQGDAASQYNIGLMHELGNGTQTNQEKAVYWYREAATQDEPNAQFHLGKKYLLGEGLNKDINKGLYFITSAADTGHPAAQTMLATYLLLEQADEGNVTRAFTLYMTAAETGYAEAQYRVALMLAKGQGVAKDEKASVQWIRKAAEQNHPAAQYGYGAYLFNGVGIEKNILLAAYWMSRAAMQGQENALESRDKVISMLTDSERDDLNKRIKMIRQSQK